MTTAAVRPLAALLLVFVRRIELVKSKADQEGGDSRNHPGINPGRETEGLGNFSVSQSSLGACGKNDDKNRSHQRFASKEPGRKLNSATASEHHTGHLTIARAELAQHLRLGPWNHDGTEKVHQLRPGCTSTATRARRNRPHPVCYVSVTPSQPVPPHKHLATGAHLMPREL